ncbi:hypothetical protein Tco_0284961 [Tanacetum coccineum]
MADFNTKHTLIGFSAHLNAPLRFLCSPKRTLTWWLGGGGEGVVNVTEVMKMVRVACRGDGGCGGFGSGGGGCGGDDVVGGSVVGRTGRSGAGKSRERRWSEGG